MPTSTVCAVPATAVAYSLNIAVLPVGTTMRFLTAWDTGGTQPNASTLNDKAGLVTSNSAVVPAGTSGAINIFVTDPTNILIDINGYYAPPGTLPLTGTAAVPALTFGDTTTGLYSDTPGTVSIGTGGPNRLTVRADGDLELPGSIRKGGQLFVHNLGTNLFNSAIGLNALANNTTGVHNTASGYDALTFNLTGQFNTATGSNALAHNTLGNANTATGDAALWLNSTGGANTAIGARALFNNTTALANTAIGSDAMHFNTTGGQNTALGSAALYDNSTGKSNTAMGLGALLNNTTGSWNVAIGYSAAQNVSSIASNNIHIGSFGTSSDLATIRIGGDPVLQTRFFAAGIRGVITRNADAIPVVIDSAGQLGTASSSRRVKRDIHDMRDTTATILNLHPVEFRYTAHGPDSLLQYGLIAEEVAEIAPDLVARNRDGEIETVYYDKVNAMLLNEVQKLHRENQKLESRLAEIEGRLR
jgi:hypothetical protein